MVEPSAPAPFTLPHFTDWASRLVLDSGAFWELEPFQSAFVEDVFGGFRACWLVVPEGNGKTTLVAGLALYFLEHQRQAAIPVAASSREQAEIIYRQAEGFVVRTPMLHERVPDLVREIKGKRPKDVPRFECLDGFRRIKHSQGGRIQVFAADDRTGDGIIPTLCLIDELHRHRDMRLYRVWRGKLEKRDGIIVAISTAGEPGSEFEETRERIRQTSPAVTREGSFTRAAGDGIVLHEWGVPEDGDVEDMQVVKAANPFSGISEEALTAKFAAPEMTHGHWRRFVCNLPTRSDRAAIQENEWLEAKTDDEIPPGTPIWVGMDVAWKWDTTAIVPLWMRDSEYRLLGPATVLVPPRDGTSLDPHLVEAALIRLHERNPIHTVVMDTSRAEQLAAWISEQFGATVVDRTQTNAQAAEDYERFMEALRSGWLRHSGDRGLTEHALNAIARLLPGGGARFDRPKESRLAEQSQRVIDALAAAAMVNAQAASTEVEGGIVFA